MKKENRLDVRMDDDLHGWLISQADRRHTSASEIARQLLYAARDADLKTGQHLAADALEIRNRRTGERPVVNPTEEGATA